MGGLAKNGVTIVDGQNLAINGLKPSGIAALGQVFWRGIPAWKLLSHVAGLTGSYTLATTGANLIVVSTGIYISTNPSVSDNQGNVYIPFSGIGSSPFGKLFYCINPITSNQHIISVSGNFGAFAIAAFTGPNVLVFDQGSQINVTGAPTAVQLPAITPAANSLVVSMMALNATSVSIDSGFSIIDFIPRTGSIGIANAFLANSAIAPLAPTWALGGNLSGDNPAIMLSFRSSPWQLLASSQTIAPATTSSALDTTGATLIVISLFRGSGAPNLSDNVGNTFKLETSVQGPGGIISTIYSCFNPITSTNHTFTLTGLSYGSFAVQVYGGPAPLTSTTAVSSGVGAGVNTVQLPNITTNQNDLVISAVTTGGAIGSIDSGFTISANIPNTSFVTYGGALASHISLANETIAPIWTLSVPATTTGTIATMLSFKPA